MDLKEKQLTREEIYSGPVFTVTKDEILLPDGKKGYRDLVHSLGGVAIRGNRVILSPESPLYRLSVSGPRKDEVTTD